MELHLLQQLLIAVGLGFHLLLLVQQLLLQAVVAELQAVQLIVLLVLLFLPSLEGFFQPLYLIRQFPYFSIRIV